LLDASRKLCSIERSGHWRRQLHAFALQAEALFVLDAPVEDTLLSF
jgi:hypothetical protein